MTAGFAGTKRSDAARHDVTGFSCGNELLDRWLVRYAGQNQRRDVARTFVAAADEQRVYAYYALLAGQLDHREATTETSRELSQHFAILTRLAVVTSQQGRGIGAALLNDALVRLVRASEQVAVRAVVVHAVDDAASSFYQHFGLRALSSTPQTLMVTISAFRIAGYE